MDEIQQIQPTAVTHHGATNDRAVFGMWLYQKTENTRAAYMNDLQRLLEYLNDKPLNQITLMDLQAFDAHLQDEVSDSSRKRILSSVKSLFTFATKLGYITFNVAQLLRTPKLKNELAARILDESDVLKMIHKTEKKRDNVLLRVLYSSGMRVSELTALTWKDVKSNGDSGQITVFGKGNKTRFVKLSKATWQALNELRTDKTTLDMPVFLSQRGKNEPLSRIQVVRIVKDAAKRAGVQNWQEVSPHWLRHCHASHALERGANIGLVKETLGHSSLAVTSQYTHVKPGESSSTFLPV